jgi:hypothetical protein
LKEVTIEELKDRFIVRDVPPYGFVVMIPGCDFDPDWEALLEEEGFGCVFTEINSEKFTLVKLEKEEGEEETATRPEVGRRRGVPSGQKPNYWSAAEEERLLWRMGELPGTIDEKGAQLLLEFPARTATGLLKKYQKLKRKSKSRQRVGRPKKQVPDEKVESAPKGDLEDTPKAERVAAAGAQLDVVKTLADLEDCVGELLNMAKIDHDIISRLNCAILLQAMETMERQGKLTIPPTLREHYLNALLQTWDNKVVETFNAKCRALMEASS